MTRPKVIDTPSMVGQFGWERIVGEDTTELAIPVIVRANQVRYSPVRIVEQEIIKRFEALPQIVFQCITLKSFYLTAAEAKLVNDINFNHCNNRYGDTFFSTKDVIVSATDAKELLRFLNVSLEVFTKDLSNVSDSHGIIRLFADPMDLSSNILVPYIWKVHKERRARFVPVKLIDPFVNKSRISMRADPTDWDIMYMKMLCIFCKNNLEQYITRDSQIVPLDDLIYSKTNTPIIFEEYKVLSLSGKNWQK